MLKLLSIESVMPSNHLIPSLSPPSSPAFSLSQHQGLFFFFHQGLFNESALHIRWAKYWSFGFSISPSSEFTAKQKLALQWQTCIFAWIMCSFPLPPAWKNLSCYMSLRAPFHLLDGMPPRFKWSFVQINFRFCICLSLSFIGVFHRCPEMVYVKCLILSLHTEGTQ